MSSILCLPTHTSPLSHLYLTPHLLVISSFIHLLYVNNMLCVSLFLQEKEKKRQEAILAKEQVRERINKNRPMLWFDECALMNEMIRFQFIPFSLFHFPLPTWTFSIFYAMCDGKNKGNIRIILSDFFIFLNIYSISITGIKSSKGIIITSGNGKSVFTTIIIWIIVVVTIIKIQKKKKINNFRREKEDVNTWP